MVTIATRGSILALWQANHVAAAVRAAGPDVETRLEIVRTTGDRITDVPLSLIGERGLFTGELDNALLDGRADAAVHSLKDLPTAIPDGLMIAAILQREDARDAWLARDGAATLQSLPRGAVVGTSSLRRRALLLAARPDLDVNDVRGNLDTRLAKLADGLYDAMILALAGLRRLGREDAVTQLLDAPDWLPAPGQGAIAVVTRADDARTQALLKPLQHNDTTLAVTAERALLRTLEGGCQVPIGALATVIDGMLTLHAIVADPDGGQLVRAARDQSVNDDPLTLGRDLAAIMLQQGAASILDRLRLQSTGSAPPVAAP